MSIYASLPAPADDEHTDDCTAWVQHAPNLRVLEGEQCSCGQPNAPLVYRGSHVLPSEDDERGGWIDLALIPGHVRYWRDHPEVKPGTEQFEPDGPPEPFLRFGVNNETVVLTRDQVAVIYESLSFWLDATK